MKVLILGSSGFLGKLIYQKLKNNFDVISNGLKKRKISITNFKKTENLILNKKPDIIINCAALTNIDYCEKFKSKSFNINVKSVENIFEIKKKNNLNFYFIQISTDQIYDPKNNINSKENSKPIINNIYSKHKSMAEKICIKNGSLILRTNFFGKYKNNISNWIFYNFRKKNNKKLNLFKDVYFSPLRATKVSDIIFYIINNKYFKKKGIYNVGSKNGFSKYKFAVLFAKKLKIFNKKKINITSSSNHLKTKRSKNMRMSVVKFEKNFKIKLNTLKKELNLCAKEYEKV